MNAILGLPSALYRRAQGLDRRQRSYQQVSQNQYGESVAKDGTYTTAPAWLRESPIFSSRRNVACFTAVSLIACVLLAVTLFSLGSYHHRPTGEQQAQFLYLLIPASHNDVGLCKTILTAEILGYPPPRLLPVDPALDQPLRSSDRHLAKMKVIRDHLESLSSNHGDSLVILLNGANSWFQLRPEVLLSRYYTTIEQSNYGLRRSIGREVVEEEGLQQRVLFSAQGSCFANDAKHPSCYSVPPASSGKNRWLDMSTTVGPVRDLLAIYQRAIGKADKLSANINDHAIMSEIYGEQELQRVAIREQHMSRWETAIDRFGKQLGLWKSPTSPRSGRGPVSYREGKPDDFGLALDYKNQLGLSVASSANTIMSRKHAETHDLAGDILSSTPPFWTVSGYSIPINDTWADVDLLINNMTNVVPAMVTLNDEGSPQFDRRWWKELWLQPYARKLYNSVAVMPGMPTARVLDGNGTEHVFWNQMSRMVRAGALDINGTWLSWNSMCNSGDIADEVFGDGQGAWDDPAP